MSAFRRIEPLTSNMMVSKVGAIHRRAAGSRFRCASVREVRTLLVGLLSCVACTSTVLPRVAMPSGESSWVDTFLAEHAIVDGNLNYYTRTNVDCFDSCERAIFPGTGAADFSALRQRTGIGAGIMSVSSGIDSLMRQQELLSPPTRSHASVIRRFEDIATAKASGEYAILFGIQSRKAPNWQMEGDVSRLTDWYDAGIRVFQIAYGSSEIHDVGEKLGYGTDEGDEEGLTDLGRAAICELNRLHMIIDVSHCNEQTTLETAALSTAPIVATHANAFARNPIRRNKTDDAFRAIADTDGVVGITAIGWMLGGEGGMAEFVAHLRYVKELVGIEHVAIATDGYVDGWDESSPNAPVGALNTSDRWRQLAIALHEDDWSDDEVAMVLGGNLMRVFGEVLEP